MGAEKKMGVAGPSRVTTEQAGQAFLVLASIVQLVLFIGFIALAKPTTMYYKDPIQDIQLYNYYLAISVMMFVGFGYLMTFLRWYGLGAVGFTMIVTSFAIQISALVEPIMEHGFHEFEFTTMSMLKGNFAAATFLISFGGLIGKVNPAQLVILVVCEAICYSANVVFILVHWLDVKDAGGSIAIHMFGAYFGLGACWVLGHPVNMDRDQSSTTSDVTSLIGTAFLWIYWPSFVGGAITPGTVESEVALTNTVLALLGSTVCTFIVSSTLTGKHFRPIDIQNATLAGGVAIGAVANLNCRPWGAILIGAVAGVVSTIGYDRVQGFLYNRVGLHDSCGIHNLHGMPSVIGGLVSVVLPLLTDQGGAGPLGDPINQLLSCVFTMLIAIVTGVLTGFAMSLLQDDAEGFNDSHYWYVADDFMKTV